MIEGGKGSAGGYDGKRQGERNGNQSGTKMESEMDDGGLTDGCLTQSSGGDGASMIVGDRTVPKCTRNPSLRVPKNWYGWVIIGISGMGWMRRWQRMVMIWSQVVSSDGVDRSLWL